MATLPRLAAAILIPVLALACAGAPASDSPRPADWDSLAGRTLVTIAAHGVGTPGIPSSPAEISFGRSGPIFGSNMIEYWDGCNGFVSPGDSETQPPNLDADGVLHVYGFVNGAVGCPGLSDVEDWFTGFLMRGPRVTIDGMNVIFDSNGTAVTMTDKSGVR
jgi:hypothetical protein